MACHKPTLVDAATVVPEAGMGDITRDETVRSEGSFSLAAQGMGKL
jgi:hypothetical protein